MDLSIVIVNWNTKEMIRQCLNSVFLSFEGLKVFSYNIEIIVIDNGSTDSSYEYLQSLNNKIIFIANHNNLGYAFGCNQGMKRATGKYVLLLGSDTVINEKSTKECIGFLEQNPDCGAVGCKILNPDGTV
ncbi:MAG: glycosyltransferase, partial [Ignavibacteria bacterium]